MKANKCFVMELVWIWRVGINQQAGDDDSARIQMSWWLLTQIEDSQFSVFEFVYIEMCKARKMSRNIRQLKWLTTDRRL